MRPFHDKWQEVAKEMYSSGAGSHFSRGNIGKLEYVWESGDPAGEESLFLGKMEGLKR